MPVSKDDFSAFDEAVKAAKTTTSRTEDDFSAFDEAVKKKRKPSDISTTEQPVTSKESQAGDVESTTSTTEPSPDKSYYRVDYRDEKNQPAHKYFESEEASRIFFKNVPTPPTGVEAYYEKLPKGEVVEKVEVPISTNPIDLTLKANELLSRQISKGVPAGTVSMSAIPTDVAAYEQDPEAVKEGNKIKSDLATQGFDADKLYNDFKGIDMSLFEQDEAAYSKDKLAQEYKENPNQYEIDLANLNLISLQKKAVSELPEDEAQNLSQITIPIGNYDDVREGNKDISQRLREYGGDYSKDMLKNLATITGFSYGSAIANNEPSILNDSRSKYLNNYQTAAIQYLEDINPEAAKGYGSLIIDKSLIKEGSVEDTGWQEKASSLEQIGMQLYKNYLENVLSSFKATNVEDANYATELASALDDINNQIKDLNVKYPLVASKEAYQAAMDLTDNAVSTWYNRPFLSLGKAVDNTFSGIWDFATEPFRNDEQSKLYQLATLGESYGEDIMSYLPMQRTAMKTYNWALTDALKKEYKSIVNNKSLSKDEKTQKIYKLFQDNPNDYTRVPVAKRKLNINPVSIYYSVVDLASSLAPFMAIEMATAGGVSAGFFRKLLSTFTAAAATGFRDNYANAIKEGAANPYKQALITTAIMSAAMAGAGTPQMVRSMLGNKTAVSELVSKLTDNDIAKILNKIQNGSVKNPILDYGKSLGKDAAKSIAEGLKGGIKFESIMAAAKKIDAKIKDQEINNEELFTDAVLGVLNFTVFGGMSGIAKSAFKGLSDIQRGALLKASESPSMFLDAAKKQLADNLITNDEYTQIKNNIELASKVAHNIKYVDDKGNNLSEKKKAELLAAKMQEFKLKEESIGDIPEKLREKLDDEIEDVQEDIENIQKPEEDDTENITGLPSEVGGGEEVEQEVTIKEMKPFTDRMVEIEREFKNNEYEIDTDYDNEIQVLDKNGEQVEPAELPDNLKTLAADYEKATSKLGEFDASAREKALAESRKVVEVEAEVVEPKKEELPPVQEKPKEPIIKVEKPTINKDNKEDKPFITKNKKHKVEIKGGVAIVTDIEGNRVPSRIYKKALREYAKNFDYSVGKTADESGQEISSIDDVIDATENPIQLAEIYANEEPATANLSPAEAMIQDYGIGKVTNKSFRRYNDVNNITMSLAKSYLSKEGRGLDQIAKDISEHFFPDGNGTEISPEDVADFMVRFPNREAGRLMESDIAKKASDKFQKLTGLYLNREIADVAVNQEFELLNKQQQKLLENEYKDQSELEKDYWSAYAKTDGFTKEIPVSEAKQAKARREKVGKFEAKAQAIADKIMATELPDWFSISDKDVTTKGVDAESMKKALADAVVNMGKLLDRGVEFSEAVKEAVKGLVNIKGEENKDSIEKGFEQYYKSQVPLEENPFETKAEIVEPNKEELPPSIEAKEKDYISVYHGGEVDELSKANDNLFVTEYKSQAEAYAKGNKGKVQEFKIDKNDIIDEDEVRKIIVDLGLQSKEEGWDLSEELMMHEILDPAFSTSLSDADLAILYKELAKKGYKAIEMNATDITGNKRNINDILVLNPKATLKTIDFVAKEIKEAPVTKKPEISVQEKPQGKFEAKAQAIADKIMAAELPDWFSISDKDVTKKGVGAEELKQMLADAVVNMGRLLDKGVEFSEALKEAVKDLVNVKGEDNRESIEKGFEQYYKAQVPLEENPFESIPKTQVARDKYFDTTFGENADKAREIYSQRGTAKEMLAKMQEEERIVAEEKKEDATWTSIRQEKLKEIEKVKNLFEKEKKTTWSKIQQDAFEGVAKEYPNKTLNEAIRAKVENIAAKYDAGQDYNPTAKDLAIIQEFKRQTESKIEQSKEGLESDNEIDRLSAMAELENYENDLLNVGKASFKREAGTAFGYRQSETKMDENYGLQIRRMRLMKANGGEKLSPADMDWTKNQWEKEKEIMKKEQEINERQLKESFDKKIAELEDKYKNKEKLKTVINKSLKQKTLSQSGKEVANIIRNLKLKGTKLDFTLGTWNIAIEGVARLVEAGSTVAEAIESLIRNGEISFATENDKDMFENEVTARIINLGNRDKSLNKIREIANDTGSTTISNEMVSKGFIKDFVNSFIGEVDKSEVLNEATRELKTILPDIGKKDLRKAFLKQDEYKQPTKKTLEESLAQAKRDLLRAERKESKKESTEDELQARKLQDEKDKIQTNIKQLKRRIEDEEYEKEEPITLSKKDAELIQLEKQKNEIEAEFRKKQKEYFEKNKSKAERIADFIRSTYVAALIGAPTTMAKVAYMSAIRPTSEAVRRITLGKVFDAIFPSISKSAEKGGESSSLKSIRKGFEAYFMQMGERKMQEKFVKSSEAYDKASKAYYDALATGADKNKIDYLKKDMDNKLLSATGNIMYQFIGGSSIKDAFGALVNRANEIEKQFGKTEIESIKDGNLLDKTNYILGFIGRSHSAAKTFSGRFSYAASFMSRLEGAARDGSISNPNRIIEIAHESYIDWERGKYQQDNWVTKKWNDVLKSINEKTAGKGEWSKYDKALSALLKTDVAITRVPVNIIHEAVSEYTLGALRAPWLAYKEYAKAKKIAIDEGYDKAIDSKQFSDRIKEIVSNIDPEYSAKIYRLFTKGGLGAGLYGLAIATGLLKFGVFPHKGQKKKKEEEYLQEGELNPGQIMFGNDRLGETASKLIEHTPALWTTFMGLGISRIYADDVKSGKTTPQAAWDAAFTHAEIIESSVPQTKIVSPLGIIKQTGKSFMGKLSTYGMFDNYIDGKGAFVNQEKKELEIKTPEISRLKEYKVAPPSLGTRSQNKIDADDKHPKVGLLKDGKPYAYMNDIEWNKFNEYRKDYVSKALKELYVAADTKEIQLNRENLTDALATITKQATRIAKLKLIDEGLLPASDQDKNENQETISDIIKEIQKESTP